MQKHLDISTIHHAGQDGSGPDKSKATPLPYTHLGTPSSIANDGLLAGRELESDAELIALGWIKPPTTTLDLLMGNHPPCGIHGQRGCTDCARVALCAETGMCAEHLQRNCQRCRKAAQAAQPTTFRPTDPGKTNSRTQGRRHLGEIEYQRCPQYANFRRTDYDGDTTTKGRGCGAKGCPSCRHNRDLRDHGKPYAAAVGDLITDITIKGDPTMAIGKGSPWSNLLNAHREICGMGALAMLGPGFSQRVVIDGIMDDLGKHVSYLRTQPGVKDVTVTIGEPPTFAALYEWMGEREEWHHGKRRWRFHKWGAERLPMIRAPYADDVENAEEDDVETGDTPAVAQLKAEVMAAPLGPERDAAVKVAELTIVHGYIGRRVSLPKVWIRALTDALGRRTCIDGTCRCDITDRGRKRHRDAAERRWTPAMYAVAAYVGESRVKELANMAMK